MFVALLQGMLVTETIMDHIAKSVGMDPHVLRTQNLYKVKSSCSQRELGCHSRLPDVFFSYRIASHGLANRYFRL